ncbi:response regulator [bacterium]|nr:response regulator [bacterium]
MKKILIVEDVEWNRDLLAQVLEEAYAIIEAVDGREGLEVAEAERPDLILMDLSLPEMDGWELAARIRQTESIRDVPIIAVTAHAMAGDEERALKAGCNGYLSKPIDEEELLKKVRGLIGV